MKVINAIGLACPKPVIETKKAIEEGDFDILKIQVDNIPSRENVKRFLTKKGYEISTIIENEGIIEIEIFGKEFENKISTEAPKIQEEQPDFYKKNLYIGSDKIGLGDDELGALLMDGFIYTLTQLTELPDKIVFMNSGVKLCLDQSVTAKNLKILEDKGVEIVVCGTCLDFYNAIERLSTGKISNMYDITEILLDKNQLVTI